MLAEQLHAFKEPDAERLYRLWPLMKTDFQKTIPDLEDLATQGSISSMYFLGEFYRFGYWFGSSSRGQDNVTPIDLERAEKWYRMAAQAGLMRANHRLGVIYYNQKRFSDAKDSFEKAVRGKFAPSARILARMYFQGVGVEQDKIKSRSLLRESAELGNIRAMIELALIMRKLDGGISRWPSILNLYVKAFFKALALVKAKGDEARLSEEFW